MSATRYGESHLCCALYWAWPSFSLTLVIAGWHLKLGEPGGRLVASLVESRAVVIDCRRPGQSVQEEIEFSVGLLPARRILLIVHPGQQMNNGSEPRLPAGIRIVEIAQERPNLNLLVASLVELVASGPEVRTQEATLAALDRAMQLSSMNPQQLSLELRHERILGSIGWIFVLSIALASAVAPHSLPESISVLIVVTGFAVLGLTAWLAGIWVREQHLRRLLWRRLTIATPPPPRHAAVWFIPAGG